jgi:hypothetical protein
VFVENRRSFYRLERLWGDAPRLDTGPGDHSVAEASSSTP